MNNRIELYGDGIGYVELLDSSKANTSEEERIKFVTSLAAISRGAKVSKSPEKTYKRFMTEAEGQKASRPMEFLPVVLCDLTGHAVLDFFEESHCGDELAFVNQVGRYSYMDGEGNDTKVYTNARALLNAGVPYDKIPFNTPEELKHFRAFRVKLPMFAWAQVMTHTALSKESQSDRISEVDEYWLPEDLEGRATNNDPKTITAGEPYALSMLHGKRTSDPTDFKKAFADWMINYASQSEAQGYLKALGYKREIYSRFPFYAKYKEFVMCAWENDDSTFRHMVREREGLPDVHKSWVQGPTAEFARAVTELLGYTGQ